MRRIVMRLLWLGIFGAVISLFGLCGSSEPSNPPAPVQPTVQRPAATYTAHAPAVVVKTGYRGGRPFDETVREVAEHLNDECYMAFEWDSTSTAYHDFYLMEGFGVTINSDNDTPSGTTMGIGFLLDFTGDLIYEPNADMLASIAVCMADETGVPFDYAFDWANDNIESIFEKGERGYFDTVKGYYVGGFYGDDLITIVVTDL